jgi:hypothetical protein
VVGTTVGANGTAYGQYGLQWSYDNAYSQCMYAKGNQLPGYSYGSYAPPPPPPGYYGNYTPPPPPGYSGGYAPPPPSSGG